MKTAPDFILWRRMSLNTRFGLIALLAACGIAVQLLASVLVGWVLVMAAALFGAARGRSNKPENIGAGEWRSVTVEEFEGARKMIAQTAKMVGLHGPFQLGSCIGCGTFIAVTMAVWVGVVVIGITSGSTAAAGSAEELLARMSTGVVFCVDAVTLLLPLWVFGKVRSWQPPELSKRLGQLLQIYAKGSKDPKLEFQPSLQVARCEGGSVPLDCRLMAKIRDSSADFLGIQVQTAINSVRGSSYPYTYCVLIARPAFRLLEKARTIVEMPPEGGFPAGWLADSNTKKEAKFPRYLSAVIEMEREGDVEIVVVRQGTGGQGYTTSPDAAFDVFSAACTLAERVLES